MSASSSGVCFKWYGKAAWAGRARTTEKLYHGDKEKLKCEDQNWQPGACSILGTGRDETLESMSSLYRWGGQGFPYEEGEVLRSVPKMSPGGVFQASASSSVRKISTHDESIKSMGLGEVENCSREWLSPLANVRWKGRDHKEEVH